MKKRLKAKREEAQRLVDEMKGIYVGADSEKRSLTDAEATSFTQKEAQYEALKTEIRNLEKLVDAEEYMNEVPKEGVRDIGGAEGAGDGEKTLYRNAFWKAQTKKPLTAEESRALTTTVDSQGAFLVPETFTSTIITKAAEMSYIRDLATVSTSSSVENIPVEGDDGANGWIDEEGEYPESDPTIGRVTLSAYKTGRIVKVTDEALQDTIPFIEGYVAMKFTKSTVKAEEEAFVTGDGAKKPTGFLVTAEIGKTTASTSGFTADEIIDLMTSLDEEYDPNAYLMMNKNTRAAIRKLKDSTGQYLWVQGFGGNPDTFDGKPIRINKYMPDIAAGAKPIAYGDFSYYHIKDRTVMTMKRLDELYSKTGHVGFRVDKRVDGKLVMPKAIKTLLIKAS